LNYFCYFAKAAQSKHSPNPVTLSNTVRVTRLGELFTQWAISTLGKFIKSTKVAQNFVPLFFLRINYVLILARD
jgi:hypothetical protein